MSELKNTTKAALAAALGALCAYGVQLLVPVLVLVVVVIVTVAAVVDWLLRYGAGTLGWDWPVEFLFASIVIIWLVINELLSILENVSAMGAPVPDFVQSLLQKLKGHTEHTMEGEEERND